VKRVGLGIRIAGNYFASPVLRSIQRNTESKILFSLALSENNTIKDRNAISHSFIAQDINEYTEKYSSEILKKDLILNQCWSETLKNIPHRAHMMIGFVEAQFLRTLIHTKNAKSILELGTFTGFSALCMASALPSDGKIITVDIDQENMKVAQNYFKSSAYGYKIETMLGSAANLLPELNDKFDLIFVDADKKNYVTYYELILKHKLLKNDGIMIFDNVLYRGLISSPLETTREKSTAKYIHEFNVHVHEDKRTEHVLLSVRDGLSLISLAKD